MTKKRFTPIDVEIIMKCDKFCNKAVFTPLEISFIRNMLALSVIDRQAAHLKRKEKMKRWRQKVKEDIKKHND